MATISNTPRPGYVWDTTDNVWYPIGVGAHGHTADAVGAIANTLTTTTGDIIYASAANTPARLGIGSTDQVLKVSGGVPAWGSASAPAFVGCVAYKTTTQTISTDTFTAITFDSELFDTDGFHNTSSNTSRFTIPSGKDGKYNFGINLTDIGNGQAGSVVTLAVYKNGSQVTSYNVFYNKGTNNYSVFNASFVVTGVATDYFEIFTKNNVQQSQPYANCTSASFYYLGA
jgi:hypothetical protein